MSGFVEQTGCFGGLFRKARRTRYPTHDTASAHKSGDISARVHHDEKCCYFNLTCDYSSCQESERWHLLEDPPSPTCSKAESDTEVPDQGILEVVENTLNQLSPELRDISMKIHANPELMFEEKQVYAHDLLTDYISRQGFKVTKHYLGLATAWRAEYQHGKGGRVVGINSEMDALAGMGHACGHNLIAISGVAVAIAVKATMEACNIPGKVILLGTPAEESGGGKVTLIKRGGYKEMDVCLMCHPAPGRPRSISVASTLAMQQIEVEFFGRTAHAGAAPWEGTNALDAAFIAYSSISVLRQQMKPDCRVHGIVLGRNWSANVIPDYSKMIWIARAPTFADLAPLVERVKNCLHASALATSCKVDLNVGPAYYELNQNEVLGQAFVDILRDRYGMPQTTVASSASTDFGNVTFEIPALHPVYAIPTEPQGGNHTPAFAKAAATLEAHRATMTVSNGLALTALRVLSDPLFFHQVKAAFSKSQLANNRVS
ncbi:hypothetical protein JOM56_007562 [Amanita muscaria]